MSDFGFPGMDSQMVGAQVVSNTLDLMNNQGGVSTPAPMDKQTFGAAVVSKTLDYMNSGSFGGTGSASPDYDFQQSVLGTAYSPMGALVDNKV